MKNAYNTQKTDLHKCYRGVDMLYYLEKGQVQGISTELAQHIAKILNGYVSDRFFAGYDEGRNYGGL